MFAEVGGGEDDVLLVSFEGIGGVPSVLDVHFGEVGLYLFIYIRGLFQRD